MYSYELPHMAEQKQDDQLEHTYSISVRIREVALKTCQRRWTIGRSGESGSGISVLAARHDDDDVYIHEYTYRYTGIKIHTCTYAFIYTKLHVVQYLLSLVIETVTRGQNLDVTAFHIAQILLGKVWIQLFSYPVSRSSWIHRLHPCRGVRLSWLWHKTTWWWGFSDAGALGNAEYPFVAIAPWSTLTLNGSTW